MPSHLLDHFKDSDVLRRVDAAEVRRLSPKAKDCQRQLDDATSVWAVDGKKFLFVFARKDEGDQKVTVWGIKNPGQYQRIKTVLVANEDDIFEAIPVFVTEYFELELGGIGYRVDEDWYLDIQNELADLSRHCPAHLKPKQKLLRVWNSIMPRLCEEVLSIGPEDSVKGDAQPDEIIKETDKADKYDFDLITVALPYDVAACIQEIKVKSPEELEKRQRRIEGYSAFLMEEIRKTDVKDPKLFQVINLAAYLGIYARLFRYEELEKGIGKMFRSVAENAIRFKLPLSLDLLEILVNTRRFNKRLPKQLSEYIKEILDRRVHAKSGFWDQFEECSTLTGKLRKVWIQSMGLRLYGYDPNTSYTMEEFSDLMSDLLEEKDPDNMMLYCRICYDSGFDTVRIHNLDSIILREAGILTDKASILKIHAALLLYQSSVVSKVATHVPCDRESISAHSASHVPQCSNNSSLIIDNSSLEKHPEWGEHYAHYAKMAQQGVSMRDFCLVKGLPYEEFKASYEAGIASLAREMESDPHLRKILRLPEADQNEFAGLMEEHTDCLADICQSLSTLTGEKIELKDMIGDQEAMEKRIKQIAPLLESKRGIDMATATRFVIKYEQLMRIESRIRAFRNKHNLT